MCFAAIILPQFSTWACGYLQIHSVVHTEHCIFHCPVAAFKPLGSRTVFLHNSKFKTSKELRLPFEKQKINRGFEEAQ